MTLGHLTRWSSKGGPPHGTRSLVPEGSFQSARPRQSMFALQWDILHMSGSWLWRSLRVECASLR